MVRRQAKPSRLIATQMLLALAVLSGCAKLPDGNFVPIDRTQTGFTAPDGKTFTGASADKEIEKVKAELSRDTGRIESLAPGDRELASRIHAARVEPTADSIRVGISVRDSGRLLFEFKLAGASAKLAGDDPNELRFKAVTGRGSNGEVANFELALLCRRPQGQADSTDLTSGCLFAKLDLKNTATSGRAVIIIERQQTVVIAKSPNENLKHETLKRLMTDLKSAKAATLQSFVVAFGPSGFAVNLGDPQICPAGRLVATNELDEPLKLNCPGQPDFTDLDGRLIGNTTEGELFLEITAAVPGFLSIGENNEHIYLLVLRKKAPKKRGPPAVTPPGTPPETPPETPNVPPATTPNTPPTAPGSPVEDADDEDDDLLPSSGKPDVAPVVIPPGSGWLFPVDANGPYTKVWARDRKNIVIQNEMKEWVRAGRLQSFVRNFQPNRDLVIRGLAKSGVPAEFALVTAYESTFFILDNYPIQVSSAGAVGPWQFMPATAAGKTASLRVFPIVRSGKGWAANPCDQRTDLAKSSEAAGRLLRALLDIFPSDPRLALMAYNMGEGGVKKRISNLKAIRSPDRIQQIKELGLGYWTIRKFGMAPTETLEYIPKFVAAYHAINEMKPQALDTSIKPWVANPKCN